MKVAQPSLFTSDEFRTKLPNTVTGYFSYTIFFKANTALLSVKQNYADDLAKSF